MPSRSKFSGWMWNPKRSELAQWMCRIYLRPPAQPPPVFPLPRGGGVGQSECGSRDLRCTTNPAVLIGSGSRAPQPPLLLFMPCLSVTHRLLAQSQHYWCQTPSNRPKQPFKRNIIFILLRSFIYWPSLPWDRCRQS